MNDMEKYVLVKKAGVVIAKEAFFGDAELELEIRKALFPENTYEEVALIVFDAEPGDTSENYIDKKYNKDNHKEMKDIIRAKTKEIKGSRK